MKSDAGKGHEYPVESWLGEEGMLFGEADRARDDRYDEIARSIFNPRSALKMILVQIIRDHPLTDGRSLEARLDTAVSALMGPDEPPGAEGKNDSKKGAGGRKNLIRDNELLQIVASEYQQDVGKSRSITDLCRSALREYIPNFEKMNKDNQENLIRQLRRKFNEKGIKDKAMVEYTEKDSYFNRRYFDLAVRVLLYLGLLGITQDLVSD